jgi:hypothetical protein
VAASGPLAASWGWINENWGSKRSEFEGKRCKEKQKTKTKTKSKKESSEKLFLVTFSGAFQSISITGQD